MVLIDILYLCRYEGPIGSPQHLHARQRIIPV